MSHVFHFLGLAMASFGPVHKVALQCQVACKQVFELGLSRLHSERDILERCVAKAFEKHDFSGIHLGVEIQAEKAPSIEIFGLWPDWGKDATLGSSPLEALGSPCRSPGKHGAAEQPAAPASPPKRARTDRHDASPAQAAAMVPAELRPQPQTDMHLSQTLQPAQFQSRLQAPSIPTSQVPSRAPARGAAATSGTAPASANAACGPACAPAPSSCAVSAASFAHPVAIATAVQQSGYHVAVAVSQPSSQVPRASTQVRAPAAPATFAMASTNELTEELATPPPTPALAAGWQASALFAPPQPASPVTCKAVDSPVAATSEADKPVLEKAPGTSGSIRRPPATGQQGGSAIVQTFAKGPESTPQQGTPGYVSERIMMFENKSTPVVKPSGVHGSASARFVGSGSRAAAPGAVDGCALFTPICKELFRSNSDMAKPPARQATPTAPGRGVKGPGLPKASGAPLALGSAPAVMSGSAGNLGSGQFLQDRDPKGEAFGRLAAGGRRDDVAKPKSLFAAEQAKLQEKQQEERRQREKQERDRIRAAQVAAPVPAASGSASSSSLSKGQTETGMFAAALAGPGADKYAAARDAAKAAKAEKIEEDSRTKKVPRRSAVMSEVPEVSASITPGPQKARPPVPAFPPEPSVVLRQRMLPSKLIEDNYEISEHADDSDEDAGERDRSSKHVPKWCESYLQELERQADMDPDTIFGGRVPHCVLERIFPDDLYRQVGKDRPRRQRGSSGDWRKDRLKREEIRDYKSRMGHQRSWEMQGSN